MLDPLCNSLHHVGEPGAANRIKLANNVTTFGNFAIAAEMIALVNHMEIDSEQFFEITSSGAAGSAIADLKMRKAFDEDFETEFTIDNSRKDLQYALTMKEEADFPPPWPQLSPSSTRSPLRSRAATTITPSWSRPSRETSRRTTRMPCFSMRG